MRIPDRVMADAKRAYARRAEAKDGLADAIATAYQAGVADGSDASEDCEAKTDADRLSAALGIAAWCALRGCENPIRVPLPLDDKNTEPCGLCMPCKAAALFPSRNDRKPKRAECKTCDGTGQIHSHNPSCPDCEP